MNTIHTTTKTLRSALLAVALAGALVGTSLPASAAEPPARAVAVADLNLANDAGRETLLQRLREASIAVCGGRDDRDLSRDDAIRACRKAAIADAIAKFDNPALVAWYASRTGRSTAARVASSK